MNFNRHLDLVDQHAFLSPSKYHWINYSDEKLERVFVANEAARRGTDIHKLAHEAIRLGFRFAGKTSVALYVNDGIGYRMSTEQVLYFSPNAFGTADSISFRRNKLRIHDLKTGVFPCSEHQLEVYAALFCLEYKYKPAEIDIELRIYQNDEARIYVADPDVITHIMDRIVTFDRRITELRLEAMS